MAVQLSPGVSVAEVDLTGFIPAVASTGGAFVGQFDWGPVEAFKTIADKNKLERWFGKPTDSNARDWFSCANFLSYSDNLNVVRVVESTALNSTADSNGILIKNETAHSIVIDTPSADAAMLAARFAGNFGDSLKVSFCDALTWDTWDVNYKDSFDGPPSTSSYVANLGGENDELHVVVVDEDGLFSGMPGTILERFAFVSKAKDAKRLDGEPSFYGSIINNLSEYIWFLEIPTTAAYAVGGAITAIAVTSGGQDYTTVPTVDITGDGTLATASAILELTGGVKSAVVNVGGTGYVVGEVITIEPQNAGVAATLTVLTETAGSINTVSVSLAGTGYDTDTVGAIQSTSDLSGTGATFDLTIGYAIASVTVDVQGLDYTTATIGFTGDGSGANATATIAPNADYDAIWNTAAANSKYQSLAAPYLVSLGGGSNGGAVTANELIIGWDLFSNSDVVDVSLMFLGDAGGDTEHTAVVKHVIDNIIELRKDAMAFFSPLYGDVVGISETIAVDNVIATRNAINTVSSYAIMDSGYKYQYDAYNDKYRWIPLNSDIAGVTAYTDNVSDPWFSPAGFTRGQIKNVIHLALNPGKTSRDKLYKNSINPVVSFTGEGTLLYGDRTQQAKPSAFQKINIRRLFIVLQKSMSIAAKYQLFEFNDSFTRAQFVNMVEPFLREVRGRRGISDFSVVCDETNNTPEVIDRSEFVADIYIKPAFSINFIRLNFIAVRSGVEFTEIIG